MRARSWRAWLAAREWAPGEVLASHLLRRPGLHVARTSHRVREMVSRLQFCQRTSRAAFSSFSATTRPGRWLRAKSEVYLVRKRRDVLKALGGFSLVDSSKAQEACHTYPFWVFGLLKAKRLRITPAGMSRLHCSTAGQEFVIEPGSDLGLDLGSMPLHISGPEGRAVPFILEAPGLLKRQYRGTAVIETRGEVLVPVIAMDCETAVGSIAGAELPLERSGRNAVMTQAVVARSFLAATHHPRHAQAFFCDTTHCQFLRAPAPAGSLIAAWVRETTGLVLSENRVQFPAAYSAACGGRTEAGWRDGYAYHSVRCKPCSELRLSRRGHGFGLCQEGAMGLARQGWSWRDILGAYFPGTDLTQI